jgi:two-component system OmpR family response regulator
MTIGPGARAKYAAGELFGMRVLVVDDHVEVLDLVGRALERDAHDVRVATSVQRALAELAAHRPEIVVLDLGLPDGSGELLCREIRERGRGPAILILTAENRVASRVRCLDAGADDYLSKPFAIAELRARVRALSRRAQAQIPTRFERAGVELEFAARRALVEGQEAPITSREWAILEILAERAGRVVTRSELLEQVWGKQGEAEAASLEVLIGRIRRKLGATVVRTVRGQGYALDHD